MTFSPHAHVTAHVVQDYEGYRNGTTDILIPLVVRWDVDAYLPKQDDTYEDVLRSLHSPLYHSFETKVPLLIHAGKGAVYNTTKEFCAQISQSDGKRVRFCMKLNMCLTTSICFCYTR